MLSKLPLVSVKWKLKSNEASVYYNCVVSNAVNRKWRNVSAASEEECVVQLELSRKSLDTRKVWLQTLN